MRINKLELFGFKSFADRTAFEFGGGISCVVGPNGSGKSNVVDALRWVIGEQSARSLRGKDMTDVIFAGSSVRSPVGFAEVTLTLGVGDGEPFPGDFARFEELEVGRRLYRDGTSQYLVNRVKARRRDIVDLFLDTGVGSNLYSFIAQGQVDRIVSQSPAERRTLIDEAAGISRYKSRREEALIRLTATGAQLDRAADVADEMGRRLRTLEKQVIKAGRFRRLRTKIRQREIVLGVVKYSALSGDRRVSREQLRRLTDEVGALDRSIQRLATDLTSREEEVEAVRGAVSSWRDQAAELEAQRREQEGASVLHRSRHDEWLGEASRARGRVKSAQERSAQIALGLAESRQQRASNLASLEGRELEQAASALGEHQLAVDRSRAEVDQLRAAKTRVDAQRLTLQQSLRERLSVVVEIPPELPELQPARRDVEHAEVELEGVTRDLQAARQVLVAARAEVQAAQDERDRLATAHRDALRAWEDTRRQREATIGQLQRESRQGIADEDRRFREAQKQTVAERVSRATKWAEAFRSKLRTRQSAQEAQHQASVLALQRSRQSQEAAIQVEERQGLAGAEANTDRSALDAASVAAKSARARQDEGRLAVRAAEAAAAAAEGRVRALRAEWEVLEAERAAALPEGWDGLTLFDAEMGTDDPRRVARPDLLTLPVLGEAQLRGGQGKGVWPTSGSGWVVVPDREAAIAVLLERGPPVAARDGSIVVDADGVVQLGVEAGSRWERVRDALATAEAEELLAARVVHERTEALTVLEAVSQQEEAALAQAQRAHREAVDQTIQAVRVQAAEALRSARQVASVEEAALAERREQARVSREAEAETFTVLERGVLDSARRSEASAHSARVWWAVRVASRWPLPLDERPGEPPVVAVDRSAERQAEAEATRLEAELVRLQARKEAAGKRLRDLERQRDAAVAKRAALESAAERQAAEGAAIQARLEALIPVEGLEEAEAALAGVVEVARESREQLAAAQAHRAALRERVEGLDQRIAALEEEVLRVEADAELATTEAERAEESALDALSNAEVSARQAETIAVQRGEVQVRLTRDRDRLSALLADADRVRTSLESSRATHLKGEAELTELNTTVTNLQLEIEGLRKRLGERYQVSLPGLLDRLQMRRELVLDVDDSVRETLQVGDEILEAVEPFEMGLRLLDDEDRIVAMVAELEGLREELLRLGDVNMAAEEEYRDLFGRHAELDTQRNDLEDSVKSIRAAIAKMNRTCRERFRDAYDRVNESFQLAYPELVGGGDARLALTDEDDLLETGVDIFVRPPGKRLQNLTLLSGGEKAMTAIALLLALFKVRPSPFCVLDEVDAPLDEANGGRFNDMIRGMSSMSQFIVITHNRKTMECADVLYGVTMASPGVSSMVSVTMEARGS